MAVLLAVPVLFVVLILQTVVVSSLSLLSGFADLFLLVLVAWALQEKAKSALFWAALAGAIVSFVSASPLGVLFAGYLAITFIVRQFRRRIWQTPILSMFLMTFIGSILTQGLVMVALLFEGTPLPLLDSINLVVLPGTLLNLLLALPVYAVISEIAQWVYPEEVEV